MSGPKFTRRQVTAVAGALTASSIAPGAAQALLTADFSQSGTPDQPLYDPITGLPGEQLFMERIRKYETFNTPASLALTVAVFDVQNFDRFRRPHDVYANSVAMIIRNRLQRHLWQHHDILARLRDDQFGLLFTTNNQDLIHGDLVGMQQSLRVPFRLRDRQHVLTTHIGAMRKRAHVHLAPDLIAMARQAAVYARSEKIAGPCFYTSRDTLG